MAQIYKYPCFVERENIDIIDGYIQNSPYRWRTSLIIPFKKETNVENKVITFIMKNPSSADKLVCDKTISNVIHYVKRLTEVEDCFSGINEIRILNMFSIYSTESSDLINILSRIDNVEEVKKTNDEIIKKWLIDTDFLVPAWGKKPSNVNGRDNIYRNRILEVLDIIQKSNNKPRLFLIKFNKISTLYPIHPERIGYKGETIKKYLLYPYKIKSTLFVPIR